MLTTVDMAQWGKRYIDTKLSRLSEIKPREEKVIEDARFASRKCISHIQLYALTPKVLSPRFGRKYSIACW